MRQLNWVTPSLRREFQALLLSTACCLLAIQVTAATRTWTGNGGDGNWNTGGNWAGGTAPAAGDDLVFPLGPVQLNATNNFSAGTVFNSITLSGTNYTLTGASIQLNAGVNATNTTSQNVVGLPLTLRSNQTFTSGNAGVSLYVQGAIDNNGKDLTIAGHGSLQAGGTLSGAGGLVKTGDGSLLLYGSNTFSGSVQILQGGVSLYNGGGLGSTNGNTTIADGAILTLLNTISVAEPLALAGTLNSGGSGAKTFSGPISLSGSNATIGVGLNAPLTISGPLSGTNGFTKTGIDQLTLSGFNSYTGTTVMNGGTLWIQTAQADSPIALNSGVLAGSGLIGPLISGGQFSKQISPNGNLTGGLIISGEAAFDDNTTCVFQLNGTTAGMNYDYLEVEGGVLPAVFLNNAILSIRLGFTPIPGNSFVILNNTGTMPVNGTFSGLPERGLFTNNASIFQITYQGGDGNDVVLTCLNPPAHLTGVTRLTNGFLQVQGTGAANATYTIQASTNLVNWSAIGSAPVNSSGSFSFSDTNGVSFPKRFYRAVWP